ncbi:MAG: N-acetylmuramoyl-L-alanine amidase [Candidatus Nanopelagicales bacterium]|nr:N-acetylmuramoyl-L-alanine amidase [Candidatus Nanopelagicales bacterium]
MRATRRRLALGSATVIIAGSLVAMPATSWPSPAPRQVTPKVETHRLAGPDSAQVDAEIEFGLIGVTFDSDPAPGSAVWVRVREQGGWSQWQHLPVSTDTPDPDDPDFEAIKPATVPLLTDPADAAQVRIDTPDGRPSPTASVRMIEVAEAPADRAVIERYTAASSARADSDIPEIISRAEWGANESLRSKCPGLTDAHKVAFVHHTASSSSYTESQAPAQLRAVYSYATGNGYCDYPYNFAVDKYGNIYEGRAGGVELPVKSGATASFNDNSVSVSALGNFTDAPSTGRTTLNDALARIVAWKLGLTGRTAIGWEKLTAAGYPGGAPKGQVQTFHRVSGHRDAYSTACPGEDLYGQLGKIRTLASDYQERNGMADSAPPTLSATSIGPWPTKYVQGKTKRYYRTKARVRPGTDRTVLVKFRRNKSPWRLYATRKTDSSGWARLKLKYYAGLTKYRLVAPRTPTADRSPGQIIRLRGSKWG